MREWDATGLRVIVVQLYARNTTVDTNPSIEFGRVLTHPDGVELVSSLRFC